MKNWFKIPREQRRALRAAYKKAGYSYSEGIQDFEGSLKKMGSGGDLSTEYVSESYPDNFPFLVTEEYQRSMLEGFSKADSAVYTPALSRLNDLRKYNNLNSRQDKFVGTVASFLIDEPVTSIPTSHKEANLPFVQRINTHIEGTTDEDLKRIADTDFREIGKKSPINQVRALHSLRPSNLSYKDIFNYSTEYARRRSDLLGSNPSEMVYRIADYLTREEN